MRSLSEEIWEPVAGYDDLYEVSNRGRIRSLRKGKILTPLKNGSGTHTVVLYDEDGNTQVETVAQLVASVFVPNRTGAQNVYHVNGDKGDNRVENLVWGSSVRLRKLTPDEVRFIRASKASCVALAKKFGVSANSISRCKRHVFYKDVI